MTIRFTDKMTGVATMEHLTGISAQYLGLPTFAYQIGEFTVDRDGVLSCPNKAKMQEVMKRLGDEGIGADGIPHMEGRVAVDTAAGIRNLVNMIHSRQYLLNKALGYEAFMVDTALVEALYNRDMTEPEMLAAVAKYSPTGLTIKDGKMVITGLPDTETYRILADTMTTFCQTARRISPDEVIEENEKYYMRAWLVRLGLGGGEYGQLRQTVLKRLKGHTAFRNDAVRDKWREDQLHRRKERQQ